MRMTLDYKLLMPFNKNYHLFLLALTYMNLVNDLGMVMALCWGVLWSIGQRLSTNDTVLSAALQNHFWTAKITHHKPLNTHISCYNNHISQIEAMGFSKHPKVRTTHSKQTLRRVIITCELKSLP
jgi:hypothetical protein